MFVIAFFWAPAIKVGVVVVKVDRYFLVPCADPQRRICSCFEWSWHSDDEIWLAIVVCFRGSERRPAGKRCQEFFSDAS